MKDKKRANSGLPQAGSGTRGGGPLTRGGGLGAGRVRGGASFNGRGRGTAEVGEPEYNMRPEAAGLFVGTVDSVPLGDPLETPCQPKKRKFGFPAAVRSSSPEASTSELNRATPPRADAVGLPQAGSGTRGGGPLTRGGGLGAGRVRGGASFNGRGRGTAEVGEPEYNMRPEAAGLFVGTVDSVPLGDPLETPCQPKKRKFGFPAAVRSSSPEASTSELNRATPPRADAVLLDSPRVVPNGSPLCHPRKRRLIYPETVGSAFLDGPEGESVVLSPTRIDTSQSSSQRPIRRSQPLGENENYNIKNNYGSESENDSSDEELVPQPTKAARIFVDTDEDQVPGIARTMPCYQWPPVDSTLVNTPTLATPTSATPTPATSTPSTPTHHTPSPVLQPFGPTSKWCFNWHQVPLPPVTPLLRREPFLAQCGPVGSFPTPYDAFTAIWDRDIMDHIVSETNRYAQECAKNMLDTGSLLPNSRITKWQDTNSNELYTFFAIILATGVVVKSNLDEYWNRENDIFITPGFKSAMTVNRFKLLLKCVHFQDNASVDPDSMTRSEAKLYKIRPILDHLNKKFETLYDLGQNIALDESLTLWKGRLDLNQFIKNKTAAVGIKTYEVCDSKNGYLWRFKVHAGKETAPDNVTTPISGAIPSLVLNLVEGLEGKGHTLWMDNFYNSPALSRELKSRGFDCVGTIRTNRQFVPTQIHHLTKQNMTQGQIVGCTSGDVDLLVWRDRNRVALTSTYHGLAVLDSLGERVPTLVQDYNICMGGVDRKDQMLAMYPIERKRTKVWYKKLFKRLLNVSVLNGYILHKHTHAITHRDFRKELVRQLLLQHSPPTPPQARKGTWQHFPAQYAFIGSASAKKQERLRRQCCVCRKKVSTYCEVCNFTLCLFDCFRKFHS